MFCFKCGGNMPDGSLACPQCGAETKDAPCPAPTGVPPQAGWPQPGQPSYAFQPPTDGKAVASMIFGILGILCFWGVLGVPAVILGHLAKSSISKSAGRLKGEGMATAGLVMGYLSVGIGVLLLISVITNLMPGVQNKRVAASESAAVATVRSLNSAQTKYFKDVDASGSYAADLATLGPGPTGKCAGAGTPEHACLIDGILGNNRCKSGQWCPKQLYFYSLSGVCDENHCADYVIVATPASPIWGKRSFCSTSDLIVRSKPGRVVTPLRTAQECRAWTAQ